MEKINNLTLEGVKVIFKNFSGAETGFNKAGNRNFSILFENQAQAEEIRALGWPVKWHEAKYDAETGNLLRDGYYSMKVNVSYRVRNPRVVTICGGKVTELNEDTVGSLDFMNISSADIFLNPSSWEYAGRSGVSCYLNTMYANVEEYNPFADKYGYLELTTPEEETL